MQPRRTSVVSVIKITEAEEFLEQFSDLADGENIYLEVCHEESKNFTSLTTFHGMIRIFMSRTWASLIFWSLVVCTCLVFYMIFSFKLLINYSDQVTFQRISALNNTKNYTNIALCKARLSDLPRNSRSSNKCNHYKVPLLENRARLKIQITGRKAHLSVEEFDHLPLRTYHSHFLHLEPSQIFRMNSTRAHCVTDWDELKWVQRAPNLTYSYKNCEATRRVLLMTQIGHDPTELSCYPPCQERRHRKTFSTMKHRQNSTFLTIGYGVRTVVYTETRKMTIVDVLSLIGGGTSLFLGCSCVTLMETFVFLFKLIVQGLTKEVESTEQGITVKPIRMERIKTVDSTGSSAMEPEKKPNRPRRRSSAVLRVLRQQERVDIKDDELMTVDNSTNPPDLNTTTTTHHLLPDHNEPHPGFEAKTPKTHHKLSDRIRVLQRQPNVDVPDEIGDHNAKVLQSQTSFVLDDFSGARSNKSILRRASTATSKASARSSRSLKVLSQAPQKRRSQIFSKHLLMNDF